MASPARSRSHTKRDPEDNSEVKSDRVLDDGERDSGDKRKQRSSKSRKPSNGEDSEGLDSSVRKKSSGERNETRKRSGGGGSSRVGSEDDDDYETRKELRAKQLKKQEENTLEKLSSWYQDGEFENKHDPGDKSGSRGHGRPEESERSLSLRKIASKGREERSHDGEPEKVMDRESHHSKNREKGHASNLRRRWDESESVKKVEETNSVENDEMKSGRVLDPKPENGKERSSLTRVESGESKNRGSDPNVDKVIKPNREERRVDAERSKIKVKSEVIEEDSKASLMSREDKPGKDKSEKHRQPRNPDDEGTTWLRDKSVKEVGGSRTPEKSGRRHQDPENTEMDNERTTSLKRKEPKDEGWTERNRDREGSKEPWKRRQLGSNEKETKDEDASYDHNKEWDPQRHGRERVDNNIRYQGRFSNRKDGRTEAVKTSWNSGVSTENYDVIEIQTKPVDYGREDTGSTFPRRSELGQQIEQKPGDIYGSSTPLSDEARGGQRGQLSGRNSGGPTSSGGSQPPYGIPEPGSYNRPVPQGMKGNRGGRGGRGRSSGRDGQSVGIPLPLMGSPFGPLGIPPPGQIPAPGPGPPMNPNVFMPPFSSPVMWSGARGVDMNLLAMPPGLSSVPPGPSGPRFSPNVTTPPNPGLFYTQAGPGRGVPPSISSPSFSSSGPIGRGSSPHEKSPGGWVPPRTGGPPGKAPSRGEQNDYSQNFVDTGMRPQNFIRELELTNVVEDYPKLRELIQKKDEIVAKSASPPMYFKCDLREHVLAPEFFGTKFDVILVDPPWEEYVHRAPGVADHMEYWTFEEILNLKIEAIADTPSFIFLWVGDGVGLEQGRQCLKKWGFRRCEDICWVKTNKNNAAPGLRHDSHTLFQHSKEHCLMGIKGTVRRSTDGHIIHANIDTDVIIAEEPPYGSTAKPEDMYRIVEHFSLGRRRLELFGEDHNIRSGWLTVGNGLSSSNFNSEAFVRNFADKDGKVWQGGGGRNPPPEAPHLVVTTPDIEALRPKSPMKNQQQQSTTSISLTTANSSNKRPSTPQNPNNALASNQEASSSNISMDGGFKGAPPNMGLDSDKVFDMYGYSTVSALTSNVEFLEFEAHRGSMNMNLM